MTKLIVRDDAIRQRALDFIADLDLDKPWEITVKRHVKKRSLEQNNLYHQWVGAIAGETGHSHDEVHEWLKAEYLAPRMVEINGKTQHWRPTTTKLTTKEMGEFMDQVYVFGTSQLGLMLPVLEDRYEN
jgi:hypothetical protein